jgi:hypothetical protein
MKRSTQFHTAGLTVLALFATSALLTGCGAGTGEPAPSSTDASVYHKALSDCGIAEPRAADSGYGSLQGDGGFRSAANNYSYEINTLVSAGGAPANSATPVWLQVAISSSGYLEPDWKMGVTFDAALPANSAACVAGLISPQSNPTVPIAWSSTLTTSSLPGNILDGFEFVGTLSIPDATVFFTRPKSYMPAVDRISICHLAPGATTWDCTAPTTTDLGTKWRLARHGASPGVYVMIGPK